MGVIVGVAVGDVVGTAVGTAVVGWADGDGVGTAVGSAVGPGVGPVKLGPLAYTNGWADEAGYQRPVELATVRLRHMVEVLTNWDTYVADATHIARRGATYLFDEDGSLLYEYRHRGVLTYSATMARPLTFLAPHVGANALNPLGQRVQYALFVF